MVIPKAGWIVLGVAAGIGGAYLLKNENTKRQVQGIVEAGLKAYDGAMATVEKGKENIEDMVAEVRQGKSKVETETE